jgi:hypothetical protein
MGTNQWLTASLWIGFISSFFSGVPSLATGRPAIVQLRPTENGLLAQSLIDGRGALSRHDNSGSGAAEQTARILEAFGTGHEDALALTQS